MKQIIIILALVCLCGCVQTAAHLRTDRAAGRATFTTDKPLADTFAILQSTAVHCWADAANYNIAVAPLSLARPPSIQINSTLGQLLSIVDFTSTRNGTKVDVRVGYALGKKSRTKDWQRALESWLTGSNPDFCPRMP